LARPVQCQGGRSEDSILQFFWGDTQEMLVYKLVLVYLCHCID